MTAGARIRLVSLALVLSCSALIEAQPAWSGDSGARTYDVSRIPPALLKDADVVVREDLSVFEVAGPAQATHRVHQATTVLNSNGREAGELFLPYDKFHKVRFLSGWIVDAEGHEIKRLRPSDVSDYSAIQGFSLYEDGRVRYAQLLHTIYPYTVVFDYEMVYDGILGWPEWWPLNDKGPVESSTFEIRGPANLDVRYQGVLFDAKPTIIDQGKRRVWQWTVTNQPKFEPEPLGPSYQEQAPHLLTGPTRFELAGVPGDMTSWGTFGSWLDGLWKNRGHLPPADIDQVRSLCADAPSSREKVRRLYEYLQSKTRYVSVQLGIGGWQPFDASYVSEYGYGDCKALTNYMKTLLVAAGVEAWPAFVRAGQNEADVVAAFPSNQFNHVILIVPSPDDTVWLECTSQDCAFGELGTFTEDRNTLVVLPDGGHIVRTPSTAADHNRQSRRARVVLQPDGKASIEVSTLYTGDQQSEVRLRLAQSTPQKREEWLLREFEIPSFAIKKADFSDLDHKATELKLAASLQVPELASLSGARLFFRPSIFERWTLRLPRAADRKQPVRLPFAYIDTDTITYQLPAEYTIESAPPPVRLESETAVYEATATVREGVLEYHRHFEIKRRVVPTSDYEEFRQFLDRVVQVDQSPVVLVRKT